jgi:hypothetical protein
VADVNHLVITRDAGQLVLERGKLIPPPVGGRTVGAVPGRRPLRLHAAHPTEQGELVRFGGSAAIDDPPGEAILLFSDSTLEQLRLTLPRATSW